MIHMKVSEIPSFLKLRSGSQEFSRTVRQNFSTEERDFSFSGMERFDTRNVLEG